MKWETNACVQLLHVKQNSNVCAVAMTSATSMLPSWLQMIFTLDLPYCKNYQDQIHVQREKLCSDTRFQGFQATFWGLEPSSASCQAVCCGEKLFKLETRPGCQRLHRSLMTSDSLLRGFPPKGSPVSPLTGDKSFMHCPLRDNKVPNYNNLWKHNLLCIPKV